jgi:hypothetical protein
MKQRIKRGLEYASLDVPMLADLADGIYHHGSVFARCEQYDRIDADESVSLISLPFDVDRRLLFLVSISVQNVCDGGCFCAGHKVFAVKHYVPNGDVEKLLSVAFATEEAASYYGHLHMEASTSAFLDEHAPCPAGSSGQGALMRLIVLAANNCGLGRAYWEMVEVNHGLPHGYDCLGQEFNGLGGETRGNLFSETAALPDDWASKQGNAVRDWPDLGNQNNRGDSRVRGMNVQDDWGDSPRHIGSETIALLQRQVGPDEASSLPKLCKALHKWQKTVKKASAKFNKYSDDEDSESDDSD